VTRATTTFMTAMRRGACKRCPRCGTGRLFERWYTLADHCPACRLAYEARDGDTWAFMYITTAGITGVIMGVMLLVQPPAMWVGKLAVGLAAMVLVIGTLPYRKGIAIAFDFFLSQAVDEVCEAGDPARRGTP
jgi:uncharacterized protein (DUF983 family)